MRLSKGLGTKLWFLQNNGPHNDHTREIFLSKVNVCYISIKDMFVARV
jgi:hypothetical protein